MVSVSDLITEVSLTSYVRFYAHECSEFASFHQDIRFSAEEVEPPHSFTVFGDSASGIWSKTASRNAALSRDLGNIGDKQVSGSEWAAADRSNEWTLFEIYQRWAADITHSLTNSLSRQSVAGVRLAPTQPARRRRLLIPLSS